MLFDEEKRVTFVFRYIYIIFNYKVTLNNNNTVILSNNSDPFTYLSSSYYSTNYFYGILIDTSATKYLTRGGNQFTAL